MLGEWIVSIEGTETGKQVALMLARCQHLSGGSEEWVERRAQRQAGRAKRCGLEEFASIESHRRLWVCGK